MRLLGYKRTLASWRTVKRFVSSLLQWLGVTASLLTVASIFSPDISHLGYWGVLATVGTSAALSVLTVLPKGTVSRQLLTPDTRVTIKVGDLFQEDGNIVVGMNDVYDTEIGDIIKSNSIQGQFLTRVYAGDRARLDRDLECALHGATGQPDNRKTQGKSVRYPIGTVAILKEGSNRYFCTAYSRMENNLQASSNIRMHRDSLDTLWDEIKVRGQGEKIAMAVLGSDLARLGHLASHSDLIKLIILSFILTSREKMISQELMIVIHPPNLDKVNMLELDDYLRTL